MTPDMRFRSLRERVLLEEARRVIDRGPLSVVIASEYVRRLADALEAAEQRIEALERDLADFGRREGELDRENEEMEQRIEELEGALFEVYVALADYQRIRGDA